LQKAPVSQIVFRINLLKKQFSLDDTDGKIAFTNQAVEILSEIENSVEREIYIEEVAKSVEISPNALRAEIEKIHGNADKASGSGNVSSKVKNVMINNALEDAKRGLINLFSGDKNLFYKSKEIFDKKEFADDFFIRLYDIIEQLHAEDKPALAADIATRLGLENEKEQAMVSLVFMGQLPFETDEEKRIALTDNLTVIKNHYLDYLMENTVDDNAVLDLIEQKRNLSSLIHEKLR
jgi:DNA primase